jgi:hypothetical protein
MPASALPSAPIDGLLPADAVDALNAQALRRKWSFTCDRHLQFEAPELSATLALWRSRALDGRLPTRAEFSMRDLKHVARDLTILDVVRDEHRTRYRCRNIGSHAVSYLGEMTGRFLDEALPALAYERTAACYATIIEARCPLRVVTRFSMDKINFMTAEFIGLPLASGGVTIDMVMSVTHFRNHRP